jgi:hypothetical protein
MARAFWKESISFGLVEIPVSLQPAVPRRSPRPFPRRRTIFVSSKSAQLEIRPPARRTKKTGDRGRATLRIPANREATRHPAATSVNQGRL